MFWKEGIVLSCIAARFQIYPMFIFGLEEQKAHYNLQIEIH